VQQAPRALSVKAPWGRKSSIIWRLFQKFGVGKAALKLAVLSNLWFAGFSLKKRKSLWLKPLAQAFGSMGQAQWGGM
jgi:hypothetical protein